MLECIDISTEDIPYSGVKLIFADGEGEPDEILSINMKSGEAISMAKWIMQNLVMVNSILTMRLKK